MRSPRNIKEIQRLIDRIASLTRFLPWIVEKVKPIMNLLKKAKRFKWDKECEDDFQALKIEKDDYTQQTKRGVNWF